MKGSSTLKLLEPARCMSVVVMASRFFGWKATSNKCCASLPLFFRVPI